MRRSPSSRRPSVLGLLALAIAACAPAQPVTSVEGSRVFARYELRHDRDGVTRARAGFAFGGPTGTPLTLDGGARVEFEGEPLGLVQLPANLTYYERPLERGTREGVFTFVDADGEEYRNAAEIREVALPEGAIRIDNDEDYTLEFEGPAVGSDEVVAVSVFRVGTDTRLGVYEQRQRGATSITIAVAPLRDAEPGDITLALSRTRTRPASDATDAGGEVVAVYEAPLRTVQIVD